jgi:beta-aspartyl-peptidase (threonine type)
MKALGGNGGVIAVDPRGGIVLDFNSEGMFRGQRTSSGKNEVAIHR